jgi:hypothetical protein
MYQENVFHTDLDMLYSLICLSVLNLYKDLYSLSVNFILLFILYVYLLEDENDN